MTDTSPVADLTAAAQKLRSTRFVGAMTATPAIAGLVAAREPLANWLDSWTDIEVREDAAMPEDLRHALAVARLINGSQP
ncbi:hypothetical protein OG432_24590 [Streptomyces sp. NBC_00442]|uniref:hypothetical protein n=1 Tax=Streptomyces sp. NBC_00442 TaxID=2903651 RepID=UPI002E21E1E6